MMTSRSVKYLKERFLLYMYSGSNYGIVVHVNKTIQIVRNRDLRDIPPPRQYMYNIHTYNDIYHIIFLNAINNLH